MNTSQWQPVGPLPAPESRWHRLFLDDPEAGPGACSHAEATVWAEHDGTWSMETVMTFRDLADGSTEHACVAEERFMVPTRRGATSSASNAVKRCIADRSKTRYEKRPMTARPETTEDDLSSLVLAWTYLYNITRGPEAANRALLAAGIDAATIRRVAEQANTDGGWAAAHHLRNLADQVDAIEQHQTR